MMIPRNNFGFNLFDDMLSDPFFRTNENHNIIMKTDVQEKDGNYIVEIDLPGFKKEDIQAELKDGYLTINASKDESNDQEDEKGNYIVRERYTGKCSRSFYIGKAVRQEEIQAGFEDGILKLVVPKIDEKKLKDEKKYISIN